MGNGEEISLSDLFAIMIGDNPVITPAKDKEETEKKNLEQATKVIAHFCYSFYNALIKEGFNEEQALSLTETIVGASMPNGGQK